MPQSTKRQITLSPSALNLFLQCPRCFWFEKVKKVKRPRGIFPSLPGGMDRAIKNYFDRFRQDLILPPELTGSDFKGVNLFRDQRQLDLWRDWRTGLRYEDSSEGAVLTGALDDLLVKGERYIPFDYKTKGSVTTQEDAVRYYQNQLDCYAFLLEANQCPPEDHAFLLYYSPRRVESDGRVTFEIQAIKVGTDTKRARNVFAEALAVLKGPMPSVRSTCEFCLWLEQTAKLHRSSE